MSHDPFAFDPSRVVPTATNPWPTLSRGALSPTWGMKVLGVGDICSDGSPPMPITDRTVFSLDLKDETLRVPDLVKMEEPKNG